MKLLIYWNCREKKNVKKWPLHHSISNPQTLRESLNLGRWCESGIMHPPCAGPWPAANLQSQSAQNVNYQHCNIVCETSKCLCMLHLAQQQFPAGKPWFSTLSVNNNQGNKDVSTLYICVNTPRIIICFVNEVIKENIVYIEYLRSSFAYLCFDWFYFN